MSKIYSQILTKKLTKWTEINENIIETQFGFQKGKSTSDCIFILYSISVIIKGNVFFGKMLRTIYK
jgi:hypothetical protein